MSESMSTLKLAYLRGMNAFLADERVDEEERVAVMFTFSGVLPTLGESPQPFLQAWDRLGDALRQPGEQEDTATDVFAGHMMSLYVRMERRAREAGVQEW